MKGLGLNPNQAVGLDLPELKPLEREAALRILRNNPCICVKLFLVKEEAYHFRGGRRS